MVPYPDQTTIRIRCTHPSSPQTAPGFITNMLTNTRTPLSRRCLTLVGASAICAQTPRRLLGYQHALEMTCLACSASALLVAVIGLFAGRTALGRISLAMLGRASRNVRLGWGLVPRPSLTMQLESQCCGWFATLCCDHAKAKLLTGLC